MQNAQTVPNTVPIFNLSPLSPQFLLASNDVSHDYVENAAHIRTILEQALLAKNISVFCDCV